MVYDFHQSRHKPLFEIKYNNDFNLWTHTRFLLLNGRDPTSKSLFEESTEQGSKFIFGFGSTCATRCKFLGALPKF